MKESLLIPLFLAVRMAVVTPAHAAEPMPNVYEGVGARSMHVAIDDLDLNSGAGRASLKRRIEHAVQNVCDRDGQPYGLKKQSYIRCEKYAWANALAQVDRAIEVAESKSSGTGAPANAERIDVMAR
jgi:UrcA family protein